MICKIFVSSLLLIFSAFNVSAAAHYDSEENLVLLKSPPIGNTQFGTIKIYNRKHIEIFGQGYDARYKKMFNLCGNEPSLGIIFLNGEMDSDAKVPRVSSVNKFSSKDSAETAAAGWVHSYKLTGDDAEDLLDLLYEYSDVGFVILANKCKATKYYTVEGLRFNFETKGLERAISRIKQ